jgi:signal transduction histidine kinase
LAIHGFSLMAIRRKCRPHTKPPDFEEVRLPVLRPIVLVILILLSVFTGCIYWMQERRIDSHVRDKVGRVKLLLRERLVEDSRLLRGLADPLLVDRELQRCWRAGDRSALLDRSKPVFEELRSRYGITHFYFHGLDRVCFLRVHDPNRYGDRIDRVTLDHAATGDGSSWGVELGPLGTLTLRLVRPWQIDGESVGYVELGEEIDSVVSTLKHVFDVELVVAVGKSFLDRAEWEEGMKLAGREANWDLLSCFVVSDHTFGPAADLPITCGILCSGGRENRLFDQAVNGRRYRGGVILLSDAADRPVGRIVVLCDIGAEKASLRQLLIMMLDLSGVVALAMAVLFGRFIRDIERRLTTVYRDLRTEIEKRKSVEEELRKHRDNLEDLVSKRTVELENTNRHLSQEIADRLAAESALSDLNKELQHTVSQLDVANNDLKDFLRVAAHDLKAPIRAVGILADWIRDDCKDQIGESSKAHLDLLLGRAQRLSRHIDRILEYSEVSSANRPARKIDLNRLVQEVIQSMAPPPGIEMVVENELPIIRADRIRLVQIFENLLGNAVKYIGKPTGLVKIGCAREGDGWRFFVSDSGPGIEKRFFSKIFEVFRTLSPRDEVEGTGMGLSIAKRVVELYGGTIWVESVVGQGSTFFFTLPSQTPEGVAESPEAAIATRS